MVYSRATTSEMAERDFLPVCFVCLGVVEGLSLAIAAVLCDGCVGDDGGIGCRGSHLVRTYFEGEFRCGHVTCRIIQKL